MHSGRDAYNVHMHMNVNKCMVTKALDWMYAYVFATELHMIMNIWMYVYKSMNGWIDVRMSICMNGWTYVYKSMNGWIHVWISICLRYDVWMRFRSLVPVCSFIRDSGRKGIFEAVRNGYHNAAMEGVLVFSVVSSRIILSLFIIIIPPFSFPFFLL